MSNRYEVSYWAERDRVNLTLKDTQTDKEVFSLWDEDFTQAIEDGFLKTPRGPRPDEADWLEPAIEYARSRGILPKVKTHFKLVVLDETDGWADDIKEKAGKVFAAYLYDENRVTNCCEITPSYELYHLYSTPLQNDDEGTVHDLIDEGEAVARDSDVIYVHCPDIAGLPETRFYDCGEEVLEEEQTWEEARDDAIEHYQCNHNIDIPSDAERKSGIKP